jgi:4-hydroxybenzoate polyprenyltransferase
VPSPSHSPSPPLSPYLRLSRVDKPAGTLLLLWPCVWSALLAVPAGAPLLGSGAPTAIALMAVGAFVMRGAGCTVNDMWDRDIDALVERTRARPLASGELRMPQAAAWLLAQLTVALAIVSAFDLYVVALAAASLGLVAAYPAMKRVTDWPQAFLGLTFNWGALVGYAAVAGSLAGAWPVVLPLYASGILWTLMYDTVYAHQDKADDIAAGVRSTALLFGQDSRAWIAAFAAGSWGALQIAGCAAGLGWPFHAVSLLAAAPHLAWQVGTVDLDDPADCGRKFASNAWVYGGLVAVAIAAGQIGL